MYDQREKTLVEHAVEKLPFVPSERQFVLLCSMAAFVVNGGPRDVFVLNGYAGTGKTSVVGSLIKAMEEMKRKVVVLAPTGRAAKVAAGLSGHKASTIHRRLYRPNLSDPTGKSYFIAPNESVDTLFVVDEASLISDDGTSRSLLKLLVDYVYSAPGCRLLLVGDEAQLPPVGQRDSTAMRRERLVELGLDPIRFVLDVPARQKEDSGIVHNATLVRQKMEALDSGVPLWLEATGFPDVEVVDPRELPDKLSDSYSEVGQEETLVITRSNWRANDFNRAIRTQVLWAEEPLQRGDRLIVSKNDYFWGKVNKSPGLIANGDMAVVTWVGKNVKAYGRWFAEVELQLSDGRLVSVNLMLRSLVCEGPAIPRAEMERLFNVCMAQTEGELSEKIKASMEDPYYNAVQAKYGYCVTCHKAQGGEWDHVYIDMGGINMEEVDIEFYRWLYTALTRAKKKVFLINPTVKVK